MSGDIVRLRFPARAEYLILPRLALAGISRAAPIGEETLADLKLAVTEACGNVVRHAYAVGGDDGDGMVSVTIEIAAETMTITVEDTGVGVTEPDTLAAASGGPPESGMGLGIIAAIADELELRNEDGGGTVLKFRKAITTQATPPPTVPT